MSQSILILVHIKQISYLIMYLKLPIVAIETSFNSWLRNSMIIKDTRIKDASILMT